MKKRTVIILTALLVLLVAGLVVSKLTGFTLPSSETTAASTTAADTDYLINLDAADVDKITVTNSEGSFVFGVEAESSGTDSSSTTVTYTLESPDVSTPDSAQVKSLASRYLSLPVQTVAATSEAELADYGLATPQTTITYTLKDGSKQVVQLGSLLKNDTSTGYAMLQDGDRIVTLSNVGTLTVLSANDFTSKTIIPFKLSEIDSFSYTRKSDQLDLAAYTYEPEAEAGATPTPTPTPDASATTEDAETLAASRSWMVTSPVSWEGGSDINTLLGELQGLSATEIVSQTIDDPAAYGLDDPAYAFTLNHGDETVTVKLGDEKEVGIRYASVSGRNELFTIDTSSLTSLDISSMSLFDKFAVLVNIQDVSAINLTTPTAQYDMTVFHPSTEEKEADDTLANHYTLNGQDADVLTSDDDSYFRDLYRGLLSIMLDGLDPQATPKLSDAVYSLAITHRTDSSIVENVALVPRDESSYYVFVDGTYTGFYSLKENLDHEASDPDDMGVEQLLTRLQTAIDNAQDGVYDFPETEASN
ncbi:MAG: DUF4340 domain-containing protein [Oscillospiraceae bacterium]|nr:DUF4340 domain-containing protein [Oscillospiraceae bacterium]MDD4367943.1 DUF4340 domain-containing protein [Oscillospiraceae bacterium]